MDTIFKDLKKALETLNSRLEGELEEVRRSKLEVLQLKHDMIAEKAKGRYIRDDQRLILSAPEIIIGDVDPSGNLQQADGGSTVIIRAGNIGLDGVGNAAGNSGSRIVSRAATIQQIAVDPGIDGTENVVCTRSEIINQARSITLHSTDEQGVFCTPPTTYSSGLSLHSDTVLTIDASCSIENATKRIEERIKELKKAQSEVKNAVKERKKNVTDALDTLDKLVGGDSSYAEDEDHARANVGALYEIQEAVQYCCQIAANALEEYYPMMAELAELNRQIKALEDQKNTLASAKADYKENSGSALSLNAENIALTTNDGDGTLREESGSVNIQAAHIGLQARPLNGSLIKDGTITLGAQDITLSTADTQNMDDKGENAEHPVMGNVTILSKTVDVQAVDYDRKSKALEEKDIAAGGAITLRAETISAAAYTKEGKATGSIDLSAQNVTVGAIDKKVEKDKPVTFDKISEGGQLVLSAENTIVGSMDKDNVAKVMQVSGDKTGILGTTTTEVQQGEGKAVLTLDGGNVTLGGSKNEIVGKTTVNAEMEVKGELKTPKLTGDNIEAKSSFKTPNISDGIAIPGAPPSATVKAKIKAKEIKPSKKK